MILKQLLLQFILIALNAFFAATEIAVISLNEKKVKAKAEDGDKKAARMLRMIEDPTAFLSTIQIGITLAGFLGSAFAAENFADRLAGFLISAWHLPASYVAAVNTASVVVITLVLSFFTLVLGELVPKRVAMRHKEKLAYLVCGIITRLAALLRPLIWLLTVSTNGMLRLMGIDPHEKDDAVSEEDIVIMLDAGVDEGTLDGDNIEYIKNVFKLDNLTAADVMTHRKAVAFIPADATEDEIFKTVKQEGYSRIPIYSDSADKVIGILHSREFLLRRGEPDFSIEKVTLPVTYVPESIHLDVLLKDMQTTHTHMAVVVNEYGITSGIVTIEDILEKLVGDIFDEQDEDDATIQKIDDVTYRVLCCTSLDEFFEFFEWEKPADSEATTVNGWLIEQSGNIPTAGFALTLENATVTVLSADDVMTHEIEVKLHPAPKTAANTTEEKA